ncbi:hypothetical protein EDC04DRAFT_2601117 [Pisolithus marmoratus]|nr:hypothetical protein EDC04DRAFT_2601117 [Pisolithus marmoratus]
MFLDHFMGFKSSHNDCMGAALTCTYFDPSASVWVTEGPRRVCQVVWRWLWQYSCVVMPIAGPIPYDRHPRLFGANLEDRWWLHGDTMHMHRAFDVWSGEFSVSIGALEGLASGGPLEAWGPQSSTQCVCTLVWPTCIHNLNPAHHCTQLGLCLVSGSDQITLGDNPTFPAAILSAA